MQTALTPLTPNEQYTHVSLWCLVAAPLIFSGDITRLDDFTLSLLTNDELIDVDQDPLGKPGRRVAIDGDLEVWARDLEDGTKAVGLFNRGEDTASVTAKWSDLGVKGKRIVRDLWRQQDLGKFDREFKASVPRHGVVLVRLREVVMRGALPLHWMLVVWMLVNLYAGPRASCSNRGIWLLGQIHRRAAPPGGASRAHAH